MNMDDQLRRLYNDVFDVDLMDPPGQENHRIEDLEFARDLFCLELSQGGGEFRPVAFRPDFPNAMKNVMHQMHNSACSKTKKVTPGFFDFLGEWIGEGPLIATRRKRK